MSEVNLIITITLAVGYPAIILMFVNINRSVKHHILRLLVIIFFVGLVISAVAIYLLTPSLPVPWGHMGSIYMGIFSLIITITLAVGYLAIILMFVNINRSVKHHIPRLVVMIFFVCLVISAVAIYLLTLSLPVPWGYMGSICMGIWGILFYILHRCLRRIYREKENQNNNNHKPTDNSN
jgi:hypothetical protein